MLWKKIVAELSGLHCHKWVRSQPPHITDIFPPPGSPEITRRCSVCGKVQKWLPGYGGSEAGCWLRVP